MYFRGLRILSILFVVTAALASFSLAQENQTSGNGITDVAGDLGISAFSSALESAGMTGTLDNDGVLIFGKGSFLVFAPSDEAFANASADMASVMDNQTELKRILSYHVVWNDGQFENLSDLSTVETLQGENLSINASNGLMVNGASVLLNKDYDSGTVYVLDSVLMPEGQGSMGVVEAAGKMDNLLKFTSALKAAEIADRLNGQGLLGIGDLAEGPFTIFAPNDAAFDAVPKATMDAIAKKQDGMVQLLSYHMVEASALNGSDLSSVKTLMGDSLGIDTAQGLVGGAKVLQSQRYDNGIIYEIDQVLIPLRLSM
jgi:transforming growth factor-beta-induced protein